MDDVSLIIGMAGSVCCFNSEPRNMGLWVCFWLCLLCETRDTIVVSDV